MALHPPESSKPFVQFLSTQPNFDVLEVSSQLWGREEEGSPQRCFLVRVAVGKEPSHEAPPISIPHHEAVLENAEMLLQDQDYLLARNLFLFVLKQQPRSVAALRGLAICSFHLADRSTARKIFQELIQTERPEVSWYYWLGRTHIQENQTEIALRTLERGLEIAQGEWVSKIWQEIGNCHARSGQLNLAREAYRRALDITPNSDELHCNLGTVALQDEDRESARRYFEKALAIRVGSSRAFSGLGLLAFQEGNVEKASQLFIQALESDPQNTVALLRLFEIGQKTGRYDEAKAKLTRFLLRQPNHIEARAALATILGEEGNWIAFQNELDSLIQLAPTHPKVISLRKTIENSRVEGPQDEHRSNRSADI